MLAGYSYLWLKPNGSPTPCTRITILKDEDNRILSVSTITSGDCNNKSEFICSLNASKFTSPPKTNRFPCISKNTKERVKRSDIGNGNTGGPSQGKQNQKC